MAELKQNQTCPYCGHEEDDSHANWEDESEEVECSSCHQEYSAASEYQFLGFKTQKICKVCGETEEDCYCEGGDTP